MIGKSQVSVSRSLEYVLALIVTRRSLSETSEKQNLFMKRLVCLKKIVWCWLVRVRRLEQGMILAQEQNRLREEIRPLATVVFFFWSTKI